ncbi:TOMM precursor leader peptide-binding protein [Cellulomonas palmilytica]|uniref:TOMM precursor leader peptide-binding protein n=1 Tax=Cellulomonas palmilytica TaxID=2608402 RepID=UPI001F269D04|nr:TOMM precursor leader peptide-binding protein [Cellulomonas palmilytica]UJP40522.1 TOMM precursor leader peptide-binding protein [Cellulomonas palmilytica]
MDVTSDVADAVAVALAQGRARLTAAGGSLAVRAHGSHVLVGPLVVPDGQGGCADCALAWWTDVSPGTAGGPPCPVGLDWSRVVRAMVERVLADEPTVWRRAVLALDRATGELTTHHFLTHPACVVCALPPQAPEPLDVRTPQPALAAPLRTRTASREALRAHLMDPRFGPVTHVQPDEESPFARVVATAVVPGRARFETGHGRATTYADSEVPAVLEGLERVLGGYRRPSVPVVVAAFDEVAAHAVDPRRLGEHDLVGGGSSYEPFARGRTTSWVWARSTREDRAVLVPEHVAYASEQGVGARFLHATSNGCAVGATREEAVLHGLLEVVERDAALLAWYTRARLVEVLPTAGGALAAARDQLAQRGLRLRVLDLTSDLRVPVALAVVTGDEQAVRSGRAPALAVASGVGPDARTAVRVAVERCVTHLRAHSPSAAERRRAMLDDFDLVRTREDHAGLYALWEARHLWPFLEAPAGTLTETEHHARHALPTGDVAYALGLLLERAHALQLDVVVVDQSAPELVDGLGVHAVKVLVPGTVPLTFGHRHRRVLGIPRLARGAAILEGAQPWDDDPRPYPAPHPFP